MARIVSTDIWACQDCLFAAVNGSYEGLDAARTADVKDAIAAYDGTLAPDFDSETGDGIDEFSRSACDVCQSHLAGSRHRFCTLA